MLLPRERRDSPWGFLALLALVVWFALGDRGSRIASDPDADSNGSVAEVSGALSAPEEGMRGVERERVATFSPAPPEGGSGAPSSREGVSSPEDPGDWRRCFTDPDPIRVRECVRARLGGRILSSEEPGLVGKLLERLLADSDTGPAAAEVLLDAERFGTLPLGYMDELLQELLATARTFE